MKKLKTRTLAELIRQEVERGSKVLATAESNVAVDNLVERLAESGLNIVRVGHPSRVSKQLHETTLAYKITQHELYCELRELRIIHQNLKEKRDTFAKPGPEYRRGLSDREILRLAARGIGTRGVPARIVREMAEWIKLNEQVKKTLDDAIKLEERIARDVIREADVVSTTNSSSGLDVVNYGDFDKTLFEGLIERYPKKSEMLTIQYRMNEKLMEFPSREFYSGKVKAAESVRNITLADLGVENHAREKPWSEVLNPENVLVFVDTSQREDRFEKQRKGSDSRENPLEAKIVAEIVKRLFGIGLKPESVGVITPYDDQRDLLSTLLPEDVEVKTVDGYQGREKEAIVISFVRSNPWGELGFLTDLRRLNVSLTRARRKLIAVGDASTLSSHPTYRRFLEFVSREGVLVRLQ